jgi:hypothetical protein
LRNEAKRQAKRPAPPGACGYSVVNQLSANASNALRRREIGAHHEEHFEANNRSPRLRTLFREEGSARLSNDLNIARGGGGAKWEIERKKLQRFWVE